jgi:threonine/homoserine/homoserine lactone efflux protein
VWAAPTAAGLAAILAAPVEAYTVVKLVGAAYLVFLGVQALWRSRPESLADAAAVARRGDGRPFVTGLLTNLLNPKIAVLYAALLHGSRGTLTRPRVRRAMERVTRVVLIGFGVRVATQQS